MLVRFWGTRGSLAKPGPSTLQYGGNTSCVEVRASDDTLIVCDGGTGIHNLGLALVASGVTPLKGAILVSHTHWDHIQGIPFFVPFFMPGNEWDVYGPGGLNKRLEDALAGQMEHEYFPVSLAQMGATIRYHDTGEGQLEFGSVKVTTRFMNHPGVALGYRLEADGATVVYATDHEPHSRHSDSPDAGGPVHREDERHIHFLSGADVLIHDAQYTAEEYRHKVGWGHSPADRVVDHAIKARVRRLVLFHHDPLRDDRAVTALVARCRERAAAAGASVEITAAAEGETIEVLAGDATSLAAGASAAAVTRDASSDDAPATIVVAEDDPDIMSAIESALRQEGYTVHTCDNGRAALDMARATRPDLMLVDWQMPLMSGLDVCRAIRLDEDPRLRTVPIVMLTAMVASEHTSAGFEAGVTDYLTKPASPAYLRSKVHQWLIRTKQAKARWEA